jgi:hypothetical protein
MDSKVLIKPAMLYHSMPWGCLTTPLDPPSHLGLLDSMMWPSPFVPAVVLLLALNHPRPHEAASSHRAQQDQLSKYFTHLIINKFGASNEMNVSQLTHFLNSLNTSTRSGQSGSGLAAPGDIRGQGELIDTN